MILARQVPQTPPLQANGRSERICSAASRMLRSRGSRPVVLRPSRTTVTELVGPSTPGSRCSAWGGGASSTKNSSKWTRSGATPNSASTARASVTMPNGPHSQAWSMSPIGTTVDRMARSRSASSRPVNSSTSRGSRESTCTTSMRSP
ncbi:Uncharacterised protein [Mycobacteroides abscessus subsp. abscessus]|nr:Uncharacterised protein [Mycobacteroides abscessus subsp. abscessus]